MTCPATTHIVLFRGVGGATQLPTAALRQALEEAGFANPRTYINSGNALVTSDRPADEIKAEIAALARRNFGFEKEIFLVSAGEWNEIVENNPFPDAEAEPTTLHVFVLERTPPSEAFEKLAARAKPSERLVLRGRVLYFHAPDGFGVSKLPPVVDRVLGMASTARNWRSMLKLKELANA